MFDNLKLYYLAQMGIIPWVHKNNVYTAEKKSTLLLVVTQKLNHKERILLNNIITFLGVQKEKFIHLQTEDTVHQDQIEAVYTLSFGLNTPNKPNVKSDSLNYLLTHPLAKKTLFLKLIPIKEHIASL